MLVNKRAPVLDTTKMSLLCEVEGQCPLCHCFLVDKKKITEEIGKTVRMFDVAHIYPLNPTPHELEILNGEELLCENIDSEDNFIALCKLCHKKYDTNKTVEEYRSLVKIKKILNKKRTIKKIWKDQELHSDIKIVANTIGEMGDPSNSESNLFMKAMKVTDKTDSTFGFPNIYKVEMYVRLYFISIQKTLKTIDREKPVSGFIRSQVRSNYQLLLLEGLNQTEIFNSMIDWFMSHTNIKDRDKSEILISYFIQSCEVFSNDNAR
ncbi:hypothetical protein CTM97_05285 [Photobacterium phosphoreum]|uniref:Uncharacterized protein n=1 Tax=Photobacterium phosphoreum TaxID=659 RepID=A0A2T3JU60_PHOPO|nr:ABC-three component system protein [Photobacterium phosphoreum]PSU26039.1 hypothetical protein CTM96_07990 [Photobacterium phosphoreum]PSU43052.1 hypothetical protein CTM97_05285 [Photobacterium phosphoreum]PSU52683.1 hypothetical protein C9J18_09050 [Photobacterium phosphoreum]